MFHVEHSAVTPSRSRSTSARVWAVFPFNLPQRNPRDLMIQPDLAKAAHPAASWTLIAANVNQAIQKVRPVMTSALQRKSTVFGSRPQNRRHSAESARPCRESTECSAPPLARAHPLAVSLWLIRLRAATRPPALGPIEQLELYSRSVDCAASIRPTHRFPGPDVPSVPPTAGLHGMCATVSRVSVQSPTLHPSFAAAHAASTPACPAPITITSNLVIIYT
jgi:hypothetical protein